jgi:hypothetical protein
MKKRIYKQGKVPVYVSTRRIHLELGRHYAFWLIPSLFCYVVPDGFVLGLLWFHIGLTCGVRTKRSS